jgi:hypothetical protein
MMAISEHVTGKVLKQPSLYEYEAGPSSLIRTRYYEVWGLEAVDADTLIYCDLQGSDVGWDWADSRDIEQ